MLELRANLGATRPTTATPMLRSGRNQSIKSRSRLRDRWVVDAAERKIKRSQAFDAETNDHVQIKKMMTRLVPTGKPRLQRSKVSIPQTASSTTNDQQIRRREPNFRQKLATLLVSYFTVG